MQREFEPARYHSICQFLYDEAALLDNARYEDWLALFADDAIYWIPGQSDQQEALNTASIIYEDKPILRMRIERMIHPRAHALERAVRTIRIVGNVRVTLQQQKAVVDSNLLLRAAHGGQTKTYAARVRHDLQALGAGWRIAAKRVDLLDCDAVHQRISIIF